MKFSRSNADRRRKSLQSWPLPLRRGPFLIAAAYLTVAVLWILFSDAWVAAIAPDSVTLAAMQTWKGILFVSTTALLLYLSMRSLHKAIGRITARMEAETDRLNRAHRIARLGDWDLEPATETLCGSPEFYRLLGLEDPPFTWPAFVDLFMEEHQAALNDALGELEDSHTPVDMECQLRAVSPPRWFHIRAERTSDGQVAGTLMDVSRQRALVEAVLEREARFAEMAQHIPEVFWIYDPEKKQVVYVSPAFEQIWQRAVEDFNADPTIWMQSVHPSDHDQVLQITDLSTAQCQPSTQEYRIQRPDGSWRWIHDRAYPICDDQGNLLRMVGVTQDITQHHHQQEALYQAAHYDRLTGLPNRSLFYERLGQQCHEATAAGHPFALLYIDLDRFKNINDSLGHSAGDDLLRQVAQRLQEVLERRGFIARLGGDEFAVLLARQSDYEAHEKVARDLINVLAHPYLIQDETSFVTVSIGIAIFPEDGNDPENLLKNADMAMYSAKSRGRNTFEYFHQDRAISSADRLRLETDIHQAVERQEFELYYQAQYTVDGNACLGVECLLRWQHPVRGMISPAEFIPLLEETGLIQRVGLWVIEEACASIKRWRGMGMPDFVVAVNVSARQLNDEQLPAQIARLLEQYEVPRGMLELELTESSLMQEPAHAKRLFAQLREMGVKIAIDDFGTGYSSLNYLKEFAPDLLKIDKGFIDGIVMDQRDREILFGIVRLAHTLRIAVIAEGVEDADQLQVLQEAGCDAVQGFLLARPQPRSEVEARMLDQGVLLPNTAS